MPSTRDVISALGHRAINVTEGPNVRLLGFAPVIPGRPSHISFVSTRHSSPDETVQRTASSVLLVPPPSEDHDAAREVSQGRTVITVERPRLEFARLAAALFPEGDEVHLAGVHETVVVGEGTILGSGVVLGPGVVIGRDCIIGPNVVIERRCRIGDGVVVGPGCRIGGSGFGFERDEMGIPVRLPHYAAVTIGDGVEIGANTVIDRGVFDDTTIDHLVKIDSQVLVGHNGTIGRGAFVIGGSVLCGGVQVGEAAWIAPGATVMEKVHVGAHATVGLGASLFRDVPTAGAVMGFPARPTLKSGSRDKP